MLGLFSSAAAASGDFFAALDQMISAEKDSLVSIRRQLHANPELSNREFETAKFIAGHLRSLGLEPREGVAKTGVVAIIQGGKPGPCILLRSDMDALPINETTNLPFCSRNPGVMHACGHDIHMTVLLGAATVLTKMRNELQGSVKIVFQPAEEGAPAGEEGGASLMIKEGVFDNPPVTAAFALHVDPLLDVGNVALRAGSDMANGDIFQITIEGKRSHGAWPHLGIDPIPIAAQIVLEFQTLMARTQDALKPAVLSTCIIEGGNRWNILAGSVHLSGTVRTLDAAQRDDIKTRMEKIVQANCSAFGTTYVFNYARTAPMVVNDPTIAKRARGILESALGEEHVRESPAQMIAEDFGYFTERVPSLYFHLGVRNEKLGMTAPVHSDLFKADENSIPVGVKAVCSLALGYPASTP